MVTITIDRGAAEALAEAAEVRCGILAAHLERVEGDAKALVMGDVIATQRAAEAVRAALHLGPRVRLDESPLFAPMWAEASR